jgi:hypothetical protein
MDAEESPHPVKDKMHTAPSQKHVPITAFIPSVGAPEMLSNIKSATGMMVNGVSNGSFKSPYSYAPNGCGVDMPGFIHTPPSISSGRCFPLFTAQPGFSKPRHNSYSYQPLSASHQTKQVGAAIDPHIYPSLPEQAAIRAPTSRYTSAMSSYHPAPHGLSTSQVSGSFVDLTWEIITTSQ